MLRSLVGSEMCIRDSLAHELLVHEPVRLHVHPLDPVHHRHLVDDRLRGQLGPPLCIRLGLRVAARKSKFVDFTDAAKCVLFLDSDLGALIFAHVLHTFPEAFGPRDVANEKLDRALAVLRAHIEDRLVVEVSHVLDLAKPPKHRLPLPFAHLVSQTIPGQGNCAQ